MRVGAAQRSAPAYDGTMLRFQLLFVLAPALGCHGKDTLDSADATADVVVVGSGPAGMAAALSAQEAGASVIVYDRDDEAGLGIIYGGHILAAGTSYQAALGIVDSPEKAEDEWSDITGVPGSDPAVTEYLENSAATLDWLVSYGLFVGQVVADVDSGTTARIHDHNGHTTRESLLSAFHGTMALNTEVEELLVEDGRVVGLRWKDLSTGETGTTKAGAVVVATGGFLRDRDRVDSVRPDLVDRDLLYETNPESDGGGLGFLDAVGASATSASNIGLYVHGFQDPEFPTGEAMIFSSLDEQLIVDPAGARFMDEGISRSFSFFDHLDSDTAYLVTTGERAAELYGFRPYYNWADIDVEESFTMDQLLAMSGAIWTAGSLSEVADLAGIDATGLQTTVDEVNGYIALGSTDAFGRAWLTDDPFESDTWWAAKLTPGLAKAFGGIDTDLDARVLGSDGSAIPGLYAAGEVVGMIPGGGGGSGFTGSVGACYTFGRIAGTKAAADAASL